MLDVAVLNSNIFRSLAVEAMLHQRLCFGLPLSRFLWSGLLVFFGRGFEYAFSLGLGNVSGNTIIVGVDSSCATLS